MTTIRKPPVRCRSPVPLFSSRLFSSRLSECIGTSWIRKNAMSCSSSTVRTRWTTKARCWYGSRRTRLTSSVRSSRRPTCTALGIWPTRRDISPRSTYGVSTPRSPMRLRLRVEYRSLISFFRSTSVFRQTSQPALRERTYFVRRFDYKYSLFDETFLSSAHRSSPGKSRTPNTRLACISFCSWRCYLSRAVLFRRDVSLLKMGSFNGHVSVIVCEYKTA